MADEEKSNEIIIGTVDIPEMTITLKGETGTNTTIPTKIVLSTASSSLTDEQINNINKIPDLETNINNIKTEENNLKSEISSLDEKIDVINKDLSESKQDIESLTKDIESVSGEITNLKDEVSKLVDCCDEDSKETEYSGETIVINSDKEIESEKITIKGNTINGKSVGEDENNILTITSKGKNLFNGTWNKYYYNSPWWNGQTLYKNENISIAYMSNRIPCTVGTTYYVNATNKNRFCVDFYKTMNESEAPFSGYGKTSTTNYYPVETNVFTVLETEAKYMEIYIAYDSVPTDVYICEYAEATINLTEPLRKKDDKVYDEIIANKLIRRIAEDGTELSKEVQSDIEGVTVKVFSEETTIEMSNSIKGQLVVKLLENSSGGSTGTVLTDVQLENINNIPNIESTITSIQSQVTSIDSRVSTAESDIKDLKNSTPSSGGTTSNNAELVINFSDYGSTSVNNNSLAFEKAVSYVDSKGGGTILFDKLYKFDATRSYAIDNKNNITFKGINGGGIVKLHSGRFGFIRNCNNIKFIDMTISGAQTNLQSLVSGDYGIEVHGGENYLFEGCIFKNMRDACLVVGNESTQDTTGKVHTKNVTVNRCQFIDCWQTSTTQNGVYNYWFTNNYINGGATKFAQRLPNGDNIYILNNVYDVNDEFTGGVIELCNYDNVYIENNIVRAGKNTNTVINHYYNTHASTSAYQTHKNITIKGNKIYGGKTAMWINHDKQQYPAQRLIVEDNTITGDVINKGIQIGGYYDYVKIKNNYINDVQSAIGLYFEGTISTMIIEDNTISNMPKQSILFNSGTISDLYIRRNIIKTASTLETVLLNGVATRLFILENDIVSSGSNSNAVYFNGSSSMCRILGNYISTKASGILNIVAASASIYNNQIVSGGSYSISFKTSSTGTVYTLGNVLSKDITLNGQTEIKL